MRPVLNRLVRSHCRRMDARLLAVAMVSTLAAVLVTPAVAGAALRPHWTILATSAPTYFKPGDEDDYYEILALNDGGAPTDGSNFTVTDTLPAGVTATRIFGEVVTGWHSQLAEAMSCPSVEVCESAAVVPAGEMVKVKIMVSVSSEAAGELHGSVTIAGGGAESVTAVETMTVSSAPVPFGGSLTSEITDEASSDSQAGSHPVGFTTILALNVSSVNKTEECTLIQNSTPECPNSNADVKDLEVALPPGMVGDPAAVPRCSQVDFQTFGNDACPADTQVGVLQLGFYGSANALQYAPVYNVEPPPGQPAELGFTVASTFHIPMFFHVQSDGDYAIEAQLSGISEADPVHFSALTIWGVPAASIHDAQRESLLSGCGRETGCISHVEPKPFLTLPTSCSGAPMTISVAGDSWQKPGMPGSLPLLMSTALPAMTGCEALPFAPSLAVETETLQAGVPTGYHVSITVPQGQDPEGLATSDVRTVQLALPQGTVVSPAAANGLAACTEQQFELHSGVAGRCPPQAKIGQISITTPLLDTPLHGSVFLGAPECGPCTPADAQSGKMVPLLIQAEGLGVVIKLAGHTSIDQSTGQLTTTFSENPQLPFSNLEVRLKGGEDAPLVNPASCGDAVAVAKLTPWSAVTATEATAPPIPISGCSAPAFTPSLRAGTVEAQAGTFSKFSLTLSRPDGQQDLGSVTINTPPGLLGMLSTVALCGEPQANAGTCPSISEIGVASATVGRGSQPLTITGGKVYLTGPYEGRPFGLSVVMPTEAGPFQLAGNTGAATEVVRASIAVDPHTAAVSIASGALPSELEGVPLGIQSIDVNIDRAGFMFNPTNCSSLSVAGAVTSTTGTVSDVSYPFQAVDCAKLRFAPKFAVSTQANASKARGASLHVKVTSGSGQANIGAVKVDLPKQLPSRLATLQKACLAAVFDANPANCPADSVVGSAKAVTPVLSRPLSGPAYLVSHGGAAFPDLEIVLQGQGIALILDGNTHIKNGITSSIFKSLPDAPISTFDLELPQGSHSVLAANLPARAHFSMCGQKMRMPTAITGQNGAIVKKNVAISVAGCRRRSAKAKHG